MCQSGRPFSSMFTALGGLFMPHWPLSYGGSEKSRSCERLSGLNVQIGSPYDATLTNNKTQIKMIFRFKAIQTYLILFYFDK